MTFDSAKEVVVLWGDEHEALGEVSTAQLGTSCAVALSRGKHPKGYAHLDPNEDSVGALQGDSRMLMAVVDGHSGFDAAQSALRAIMEGDHLDIEPQREALARAFSKAKDGVGAALADVANARHHSKTSISVALLDGETVFTASLGDSSAVILSGDAGTLLGGPSGFLDAETDLDQIVFDQARLESGDRVVLCTDGLSDFLGRKWIHRLEGLRKSHPEPVEFAQATIRAAFAGGAGDNIAVAVYAHN